MISMTQVQDYWLRRVLRYRPFYRRYPYTQPVNMQAADRHGAIDRTHRFFYNRIPKCANSTVVQTLATCRGGTENRANVRTSKRAFTKPMALGERDMDLFDRAYFKFTFVRDPYSRLVSAYLDKMVHRGYAHRRRYRVLLADSPAADAPPSIDRFLDYLDDGGLYANVHWAPQTALLLIPLDAFDFIGKLESLDKDLPHVLCRLFPDTAAARSGIIERAGPPATGAKDKVRTLLTPRQIDRVSALYHQDIKDLGYAFM